MSKTRSYVIGRTADVLLGLAFILGAFLKALSLRDFEIAISFYGLVEKSSLFPVIAFTALALETLVGILLVAGWRLKGLTHLGTLALLAGFSLIVGYGWICEGLEDCGCLGASLPMTPQETIGKNVILALMTLVGLVCSGGADVKRRKAFGITVAVLSLGAVAGATAYGIAEARAARILPPAPAVGSEADYSERPYAKYRWEDNGEAFDLGEGQYMVVLLSATCYHCREWVEPLNDLMLELYEPQLVALVMDEGDEFDEFVSVTGPLFPLHLIDTFEFMDLYRKAPPELALVDMGRRLKRWEGDVPPVESIQEALDAVAKGHMPVQTAPPPKGVSACLKRFLD